MGHTHYWYLKTISLDELPRLHHVLGPIYTDGAKRYRVVRLKYPYDPGTYTFEEL